jgi:hypothetical protein
MKTRKVYLFKVDGQVVIEERRDLTPKQLEDLKWLTAEELDVAIFDVDVETIEIPEDLSDIDVTSTGLIDWKDNYFKEITGIKLTVDMLSDEFLDAVNAGTTEQYLEFLKIN